MSKAQDDFWNFDVALEEAPTCRVIMFQGEAQSGKTYTTAKLCKRTVFISTDGNAQKQGYRALNFKLLPKESQDESPAQQVWRSLVRILQPLYKNKDKFDGIAFDLIEHFDNIMQAMYTGVESGEVERITIQDWGEIRTVYQNLNYYLDKYFDDKVIFFLSRQVEEEVTDAKMKKKTVIVPAIRKKLSNLIDGSVSMNLTIDADHTLEFAKDYRYEGTPTNPVEAEVLKNIIDLMKSQGTI